MNLSITYLCYRTHEENMKNDYIIMQTKNKLMKTKKRKDGRLHKMLH